MDLVIHNMRSFDGHHEIPIRPLTLLTGENSSGKSTLLAVLSMICDPRTFPLRTDFNQSPFDLGNFDTIATFKGGRAGRAEEFCFGYKLSDYESTGPRSAEVTYISDRGKPMLSRLKMDLQSIHLDMNFVSDREESQFETQLENASDPNSKVIFKAIVPTEQLQTADVLALLFRYTHGSDDKYRSKIFGGEFIRNLTRIAPYSAATIAPIRSKPKRTYDSKSKSYSPEGDHVPYLLSEIFSKKKSASTQDRLIAELAAFGKDSGLFERITTRFLGTKAGEPFQIMVKPRGKQRNLIDVGYGVSQVLPVLVQSLIGKEAQMFLLQQPEVHLHPRAQAALGSFFAKAAGKSRHFIVETHSDYIIDRVRIEVANGTLQPDDVQILYLEKPDMETTVHKLSLDMFGNIEKAPGSYRQFFLKEEDALLTRTSGRS